MTAAIKLVLGYTHARRHACYWEVETRIIGNHDACEHMDRQVGWGMRWRPGVQLMSEECLLPSGSAGQLVELEYAGELKTRKARTEKRR